MKTKESLPLGGAQDRPWHMRVWSGICFRGLMRILLHNRFAVSPSRLPMAAILSVLSMLNSVFWLAQHLIYGRAISRTALIEDPVFIIGHWRSGTTLLHELFACDSHFTFPNTYTAFAPNHFLLTEKTLKCLTSFLLPSKRPMDNMKLSPESPQEDEWALCNMGLPSPYWMIMFPNHQAGKMRYLDLRDMPEGEVRRWENSLLWYLKCFTRWDAKRIVLKSPPHTGRIRTLLEMFPNARFVHITRSPYEIFPSTLHTWKRMCRYHGLQMPSFEGLEDTVLDTFRQMYELFEKDLPLLRSANLYELRYEDLVAKPVAQMEMIYERLGLGSFEEVRPRIESYAASVAGYHPNRWEVSSGMRQRIAEEWSWYFERYGY